ncbi:MAG: tetratricopeptide repeat protein [Candidatus Fermentibacteraceae bacterium]
MTEEIEELRSCLDSGDPDRCIQAVQAVYDGAVSVYRDGDLERARKMVVEGLSMLAGQPGLDGQKALLNRALADFNYIAGRHREALLSSHAAASYYHEAGDVAEEVGARGNYGSLLLKLGDLGAAYRQLSRTLEMAKEHGMPKEEGQARLNISDILHVRGEYEGALEHLHRAGELFELSGYEPGEAFCLDRIAKIKYESDDYDEAIAYHQRALESRREEGLVWEKLMVAAGYARTLIAAGRPGRALAVCRETLKDTAGPEQPDFRARLRLLEAEALLELKRPGEASKVLETARGLFGESQGDELPRKKLKKLRARVLRLQGDAEEAFDLLEEYIEDYEELKRKEKDHDLSQMRIAAEVRTAIQRDEIAAKNRELEQVNADLRRALSEVKTLSGMLPICASCKRIRDDDGYWQRIETYVSTHSTAQFSHGLCSDCMKRLYPEMTDSE